MTDDEICLLVVQEAMNILSSEDNWNHNAEFGESCSPDATQFSLGCAMEKAQLLHRKEKKNRSKEMRVLRRRIYRSYFWRAGIHPVSYFNKHHKTTFGEVKGILEQVKQKFED